MLCQPRAPVVFLLAWLAGGRTPKSPAASGEGVAGQSTSFGRPAVVARDEGDATLTVGMEDIPPGDSIGVHKHLQEDEVVFVYRGEVEVTLGGSLLRATAGATGL
jgi:quercetin dioxygenase-like cupin family protein